MVETVLVGKKKNASYGNVNTRNYLSLLLESDGSNIGETFLTCLSLSATEEGAYKALILKKPALCRFERMHPFFRPFMMRVGKEINEAATSYKMFLSLGAAAFSLFDVISDIYTIAYFYRKDLTETAQLMTALVVLSLFLQLLVVFVTHHRDKRIMMNEMIGTVTFTKPAFNKFRVLTNAKPFKHTILPQVSEMMIYKIAEMISESIPMTVIQVREGRKATN